MRCIAYSHACIVPQHHIYCGWRNSLSSRRKSTPLGQTVSECGPARSQARRAFSLFQFRTGWTTAAVFGINILPVAFTTHLGPRLTTVAPFRDEGTFLSKETIRGGSFGTTSRAVHWLISATNMEVTS